MRSRIARSIETNGASSRTNLRASWWSSPSAFVAPSGWRLTTAVWKTKEPNGHSQALQRKEGELSDLGCQCSRHRRTLAVPRCVRHSPSSLASPAAAKLVASFSSSSSPSSPSEGDVPRSAEQHQRHPSLKLMMYDSLSKSARNVFETEVDATPESSRTSLRRGVAVYACGPTVYAPAHLGHARTYVCLDVLRRVMDHVTASTPSQASSFPATTAPPQPLFVLNITDVDDKILTAASDGAESPLELARRYEAEFWRDWDALNLLRPHVVTRVTEHVRESIVPYIRQLVENGTAYEDGDGDVYFDVQAFESKMQLSTHYGKLAPASARLSSEESAHNAANDDPQSQHVRKRDPRDFALWKRRKPGEGAHWDSPFGAGRPGWHIECSAMIHAVQQQFKDSHGFALHAGGVDLQFPHHCNEIAQAEAYYSNSKSNNSPHEWIPHWVHAGHLYIDGMKMSKSLKNFITIQDLLSSLGDGAESALSSPADVFRLWCLSSSYRDSVTYSAESIAHAGTMRDRMVQLLLDGEEWLQRAASFPFAPKLLDDDGQQLLALALYSTPRCLDALTSDLDGPTFLRDVSSLVGATKKYIESDSSARSLPSEPVHASLRTIRNLLGLVGFTDVTTRAGLSRASGSVSSSNIVGGERALLDELSRFRASIRTLAVAGIRSSSGHVPSSQGECLSQILAACDHARDHVLPSLGVELFDHPVPVEDASGGDDADGDGTTQWRYCVPRTPASSLSESVMTETQNMSKMQPELDLRSISPTDYFRVGQYEGQFKEFDADGLPTVMSDGAPVSNRLRQKLQKKLEKHLKRLDGDVR